MESPPAGRPILQPDGIWSDLHAMAYFGSEQWVALFALGAFGILTILYVLAVRFQRDRNLHDLRIGMTELRRSHAQRLAALRKRELGSVAAPAVPAAPAETAEPAAPTPTTTLQQAA